MVSHFGANYSQRTPILHFSENRENRENRTKFARLYLANAMSVCSVLRLKSKLDVEAIRKYNGIRLTRPGIPESSAVSRDNHTFGRNVSA